MTIFNVGFTEFFAQSRWIFKSVENAQIFCSQCGNYRKSLSLLWRKFRESNVFTKEITKELIWRNFLRMTVNFSFFHTVLLSHHRIFLPKLWERTVFTKYFTIHPHFCNTTEIQCFSAEWHSALISRNFFQYLTNELLLSYSNIGAISVSNAITQRPSEAWLKKLSIFLRE